MTRRAWRSVSYTALGVLLLALLFQAVFPAEMLGRQVARKLEAATSGEWRLELGRVRLFRFSGIAAHDLKLAHYRGSERDMELPIRRLRGRIRLLPLLSLRKVVVGDVELGEGTLTYRVDVGSRDLRAEIDLHDLDLRALAAVTRLAGLPLEGYVSGSIRLRTPAQLARSSGEIVLALQGASVGPGAIQGFPIPRTALGNLSLTLKARDGELRVEQFHQEGGDVRAKIEGAARLRTKLPASSYEMCIRFRAERDYLRTYPRVATALQLARMQLRRDRAGFFHVPVAGRFKGAHRRGRGLCNGQRDHELL